MLKSDFEKQHVIKNMRIKYKEIILNFIKARKIFMDTLLYIFLCNSDKLLRDDTLSFVRFSKKTSGEYFKFYTNSTFSFHKPKKVSKICHVFYK